ncbi:type II and III secretion system protein family protein [Massilia agilis]|uniref:Type II and III secretion system protein family protein n=1 Tax=Massilia agilis TaxID=1811226 RepID=A0ABT2D6R2_9BURK|nr:type II and III secretion system protein family protein [Massilia agilis]MCS0806997.1 type II and III secretion system protein family protein [Massilia agilis]
MNTQLRITALAVATTLAAPAWGAADAGTRTCKTVLVEPPTQVMLGKASVIPLAAPVSRIVASGLLAGAPARPAASAAAAVPAPAAAPGAASDPSGVAEIDVLLLSPSDLFLRGKKAGASNIILQDANGACYLRDVVVSIDPAVLQAKLAELMPEETGITVRSAENSIVLTGKVTDLARLDEAVRVATAYGDGKRVVNLLTVTAPQQVMLEVKIAEVSKTLLDKFGIDFARMVTSADGLTSQVLTGIFGGAPAVFGKFGQNIRGTVIEGAAGAVIGNEKAAAKSSLSTRGANATLFGVDAQKKDGLVRVLAEPNIMAISGQSASFLSGGKIFIPVSQSQNGGAPTITLEEKEFGVGLKFSPTVLDRSRVNLKLVSEVSELSQTGSPFTTVGGVTSVLPSVTTRRIDTTVQLSDGQSFAVAGLIRNNVTETISRFPGLGDLPILGALFRSTEFQKDQTELIFIITPRLVKPAEGLVAPTDNHVEPSRSDAVLRGKAEGLAAEPAPGK